MQIFRLLYNLIFTSIPVLVMGIFDKDLIEEYLILAPPLYGTKAGHTGFTIFRFFIYTLDAIYQSVICFFLPMFIYDEFAADATGRTSDILEMGILLAICVILNANWFVLCNLSSLNSVTFASIIITNLFSIIYGISYSEIPITLVYGTGEVIFSRISFWLCILIVSAVCQFPRLLLIFVLRTYFPSDVQVMQEIAKINSTTATHNIFKLLKQESSITPSEIPKVEPIPSTAKLEPIPIEEPHQPEPSAEVTSPKTYPLPPRIDTRTAQSEPHIPGLPLSVIPEITTTPVWRQSSDSLFSIEAEAWMPLSPMAAKSPSSGALGDAGTLTIMTTGQLLRNRGYSFSQSPGARNVILNHLNTPAPTPMLNAPVPFKRMNTYG